MDIRELDKKQLILLTLLITFVVSIATGIVTVSLMNQMPKSVPQTINNVIQKTIEKVTTVQVPTPDKTIDEKAADPKNTSSLLQGNSEALIPIYLKSSITQNPETSATDLDVTQQSTSDNTESPDNKEETAIGQGVIISDIGLVLVDSNLIKEGELYKVILNKINFNVSVLKKFDNGFTIMKISQEEDDKTQIDTDTKSDTQ